MLLDKQLCRGIVRNVPKNDFSCSVLVDFTREGGS